MAYPDPRINRVYWRRGGIGGAIAVALTLACVWPTAVAEDAPRQPNVAGANVPGAAERPLPDKVRFNRDIRPIFSNVCWACHGPDANTREADLRLDVRANAVAERDGFRPIMPGNAEESEAYQLITARNPADQMPPADFHVQLTDREKALIKKWIDQGAAYEEHWAFIAPRRPAPPTVKHADAVRNPIDAFVIARLEAEGLAPAKPADRRTLLRRVTLDLTGLPPTPDEIAAFINDTSADAYEKAVDRLLASPRFGEHQARHWLDVARYADTNGYQYDTQRDQWVWRDWVIHAFNTNKPFDRFTIEQIAGDLLPDADDQTRLATAFNRNHPITIEGGVIEEEYRTEYVMDRVVTTTTAWMGLTYLCARCHDHKYDPISQADFYSMYAYFNNVPEKGHNGFAPQAKIASPLDNARRADAEAQVAALGRDLKAALRKAGANPVAWERQAQEEVVRDWSVVEPVALSAANGAALETRDDGSIQAVGPNPATETYEIAFTAAAHVRALKLEALPDKAHVNGSTGRGSNGNFVLTEFAVEHAAAPEGAFEAAKIASAAADYQQNGYPVAHTIDGTRTGRGGWAVDGNTRFEPSVATYELAEPVPAGATIRVRMIHTWGGSHTIGRFRLSASAEPPAAAPADVAALFDTPPAKRTPAQRDRMLAYLVERYGGDDVAPLARRLTAAHDALAAVDSDAPATLIMAEMNKPRPAFVLDRGEYDKALKDRPVTPGIPAVLGDMPSGYPANRLGLARWLVARDNPLTARVIVNRYWAQLFGTGIVKTVEDFGSQGEYPSHPDLLDWLAVEFVDSGWDVKALLKTIVTSGTYRQSSAMTAQTFSADPHNRLLARGPRYRVDAETVRDSALFVSGLLDQRLGGPSVFPYHPQGLWLEINNRPNFSRAYPHSTKPDDLYRRSMYTYWKRTVPPPSMATFDAPEREYCVVNRSRTNTPLQAFVMLHDPQFVEAARKLAERMAHEGGEGVAARLAHGFELCTGREPTAAELAVLADTYTDRVEAYRKDPAAAQKLLSIGQAPRDASIDVAEHAALTTVARLLLNLSEFITKG